MKNFKIEIAYQVKIGNFEIKNEKIIERKAQCKLNAVKRLASTINFVIDDEDIIFFKIKYNNRWFNYKALK